MQRAKRVRRKTGFSLRWGLLGIIGVCWLLPLLGVVAVSGYFLSDNLEARIFQTIETSVQSATTLVKSRFDGAMESSRRASYDQVLRRVYQTYQKNGDAVELYSSTTSYLTQQYAYDDHFNATILYYTDDPQTLYHAVYRVQSGAAVLLRDYRAEVHERVQEIAVTLGTDIRFFEAGNKLYMVRNLVDSTYVPYAVIVMEYNEQSLFESVQNIVWMTAATVTVDGVARPAAGGGAKDPVLSAVYDKKTGSYTVAYGVRSSIHMIRLTVVSDGALLMQQVRPVLARMLLLISALVVPLLLVVVFVFRRHVNEPVDALVKAAVHIESGERGYQIETLPTASEFRYLTAQFNHMSEQLQLQFERSYQEQLALQDARIKALQSQINPHFLNNTLEIVNWEARMAGNDKVSNMLEALATMLGAATARGGKPTVPLSEELSYVDAYLYIISERLGERLTVVKRIDERLLGYAVPRLVLQPIVENAVEHGLSLLKHGELVVRVHESGGWLLLEVEHDGRVTDADRESISDLLAWDASGEMPDLSGHIGIRNVNRRLKILYGEESGLTIEEIAPGRTLSRITMPLQQG